MNSVNNGITAADAITEVAPLAPQMREDTAVLAAQYKPVLPFLDDNVDEEEDEEYDASLTHMLDALLYRPCCGCGVPHWVQCDQPTAADAYECWRNQTYFLCVTLTDNQAILRTAADMFAPMLDTVQEDLVNECNHLAQRCAEERPSDKTEWASQAQTDKKRILAAFRTLGVYSKTNTVNNDNDVIDLTADDIHLDTSHKRHRIVAHDHHANEYYCCWNSQPTRWEAVVDLT